MRTSRSEERALKRARSSHTLQGVIKTITNATSYGIFVEINPAELKGTKLRIHGNSPRAFTLRRDRVEEVGPQFNPVVAAFISSAEGLGPVRCAYRRY